MLTTGAARAPTARKLGPAVADTSFEAGDDPTALMASTVK